MTKKYRLKIPDKYLRWLHPEFKERNGEISDTWDDELHELGWLEEIKEPMTFEKWLEKQGYPDALYSGTSRTAFNLHTILRHCHDWTIENYKLEQEQKCDEMRKCGNPPRRP